jgi:hypothetical protein
VPGQYQLIPHIDEVIRTNETANVVVVALAENLFIHPCSLLAIGKVVVARRAAPADVQRQFHHTTDLLHVCGIEVIG